MRVILLFALLVVSCAAQSVNQEKKNSSGDQQAEAFRVIIPQDTWEAIYFKEINERAAIAKLPNMRAAASPKGDLQTRIWMGFGLTALRGFDLKRSSGQWQGMYIEGIYQGLPRKEYQITLRAPKSGWEAFWQKLLDAGILTLPDGRSIGCDTGALDGISYVVENNIDNTYRTYMYDNPQLATCKEAQQIIQIVNLFADEFGSQLPRRS